MVKVEIYSTVVCPYCTNAKKLLDKKGMQYEEIMVDRNPVEFENMLERSNGRRTVPQIFIDDVHVGGFDDMSALDAEGKLDNMLGVQNG